MVSMEGEEKGSRRSWGISPSDYSPVWMQCTMENKISKDCKNYDQVLIPLRFSLLLPGSHPLTPMRILTAHFKISELSSFVYFLALAVKMTQSIKMISYFLKIRKEMIISKYMDKTFFFYLTLLSISKYKGLKGILLIYITYIKHLPFDFSIMAPYCPQGLGLAPALNTPPMAEL